MTEYSSLQEMEREAEEILRELALDSELDAVQVTPEMDATLMKKIRKYEEEQKKEANFQ